MIKFPEIEATKYVRTLKNTEEDFQSLAECFNSFKDSDSWPGGFGGSYVFTKESVKSTYESKDLSSQYVITAPDNPSKIVGVCFLNRSWIVPDAWYVELLGVSPAYQNKKLGKALMLAATKFCTEKKVRFVSLHTWEGNLKAMPFYKKQGYKWRPKTSVYMENYIPQILNFPLFHEFFEKYCWYDIFKPHISQEMDDEKDQEMLVYEYYFEADANNFLRVWIDRTVGQIAGFHFKFKEHNLLIKAYSKPEAYIGIETFPVKLTITNYANKEITLICKNFASADIRKEQDFEETIVIQPNATKTLETTASLSTKARELNLNKEPDKYTHSEVGFEIQYENYAFKLAVGKLPRKIIKCYTFPYSFPWIKEKGKTTIPLVLENRADKELDVEIEAEGTEALKFEPKKVQATISRYDTIVELHAEVKEITNSVQEVKIKVTEENKALLEETLSFVLSNVGKAYAYESEDHYVVENEVLLMRFFKHYSTLENAIQFKDKTERLPFPINGFTPILGMPFDDEGSEFCTKQLEHEIITTDEGIVVQSSAVSDVKKGIKVIRKVLLPNTGSYWKVWWEIENVGLEEQKELGIQFNTWNWLVRRFGKAAYFPFQQGLKVLQTTEILPFLGSDPSELREGWIALEFENKALGVIFDRQALSKVYIEPIPTMEAYIETLQPKAKIETSKAVYVIADSWQEVRKYWQKIEKKSEMEIACTKEPMQELIQIGFKKESSKQISSAIIVSDEENVSVVIDAFKEAGIKGKIHIDLPIVEEQNINIQNTKAAKWTTELSIKPGYRGLATGTLTFDTTSRIYKYPAAIGVYSSSDNVSIKRLQDHFIVSNGIITFRASEKIAGRIFEINYHAEPGKNYLLSNFPEPKPFIWWAKFIGGIGPVVTKSIWGADHPFVAQKFEGSETKIGDWQGIAFKSPILTYHPALKGIQVTTSFLILPDLPIILTKIDLANHSGTVRKLNFINHAFVKTSKSAKDRYYVPFENKVVEYSLNDEDNRIYVDQTTQWAAYKNSERKKYFAVAYPPNINLDGIISPATQTLQFFNALVMNHEIYLKPEETKTYYITYALLDDLDEVQAMSKLLIP